MQECNNATRSKLSNVNKATKTISIFQYTEVFVKNKGCRSLHFTTYKKLISSRKNQSDTNTHQYSQYNTNLGIDSV